MTEFLGLLLLGIIAGAGWLKRKAEEAAHERAAQENQARLAAKRAPAPPNAQNRPVLPAASRKAEQTWRGSMEETQAPASPQNREAAWRGSMPETRASASGGDDRTAWRGSMPETQKPSSQRDTDTAWRGSMPETTGVYSRPGDIASQAEQRSLDPGSASVRTDGEQVRKPKASAVLPLLTRESVVQAVVLSEILSRPRGLRRGRRPAR